VDICTHRKCGVANPTYAAPPNKDELEISCLPIHLFLIQNAANQPRFWQSIGKPVW
jgi:hypothetical protein